MSDDRTDRIRRRAYEIWMEEGRPEGRNDEHWAQTCREIALEPSGTEGTTDQNPRWEGPPENRPRGYEPAIDDPANTPDATGETLADPGRSDLADAFTTKRRGGRV